MPLKEEYEEFLKVTKLVLKEQISQNKDTLQRYRCQVIEANNKVVQYINSNYNSKSRTEQAIYDDTLEKVRNKAIQCFNRLKCTHELSHLSEIITEKQVGEVQLLAEQETESQQDFILNAPGTSSSISPNLTRKSTQPLENPKLQSHIGNIPQVEISTVQKVTTVPSVINPIQTVTTVQSPINSIHNSNAQIMDQSERDLIKRCDETLRPYSGDPLGLTAFLIGLKYVERYARTPELKQALFDYVLTKLEGRALEFYTEDITTLEHLRDTLKANIKPVSSDVIKSRMLSLKYTHNNSKKFSEDAEALADDLRRTLVSEKIPPNVAEKMVIKKTIDLCCRNTQSPVVLSVLQSSAFETPRDVISKMINTINDSKMQVLAFGSTNRRGRGNQNNNNKGRFGNQNNNNNNNSNNNFNNNNYNNNNYNRNGGNRRGRGRGGNRGRGNFRNFNYNNDNNGYRHNGNYVRVFTNQGNAEAAPRMLMGPEPNQPQQQ